MGLLDRAMTLESDQCAAVDHTPLFDPDLNTLFERLNTTEKGLEFPSHLFSGIIEELQISKGALLLPDKNRLYTPWSVEGFDQTTSRRIRIPENLLSTLQNESCSFVQFDKDEIELLKDFFSFREYSVTEKVLIAPIKSDNFIVALLFISEGLVLEQPGKVLSDLFSIISHKAGSLLNDKRESILDKLQGVSSEKSDMTDILNSRMTSDPSPFLLLSLKLDSFITEILKQERGSIDFRIIEDILKLVKTLMGDRGEVTARDSRSLYVLLNSSRRVEAELFIHQIGLSLSYFYKMDKAIFKPLWKMVCFPEEAQTPDELIRQLEK